MSYTNQVDSKADRGFGESYYFPPIGGELPPFYPAYNGLPLSQTQASLPSISSSGVASSTSGVSSWSQSPSSLSDNLSSQPILEPETEERKVKPAVTRPSKRKRRSNSVGRVKGQIKRPAGTGYAAMFKRLPADIQQDVVKRFDCCGNIGMRDNSTMHKHWISTRHYHKAVGDDRLHTQPGYTCPAFLSMHSLCTNAEAGRYESAYRHCESCAGFQQVQVESGVDVTPVELTRGEYRVPQKCAARPGYLFWANPERRVQRDHDDCH